MREWTLLVVLMLLLSTLVTTSTESTDKVCVIEIHGMITAGTALHVESEIKDAARMGASAVLIKLDTPGGLVSATLDIVRSIDNSPIQVITYVSPKGAIAASAGTYILLAGHVAAMSPGTTCGACMPVTPDVTGEPRPADEKTIKFLTAHIRGIAEERGRPVDLAERFVTENLALTANEALEKGVVDVIADDVPDLLSRIGLADAETYTREKSFRNKIADLLSNPQIAFILLLVGMYGLIFGFMSPGTYVPETIGAICLILALYGLGTFDVGVFGIILIIAAVILFIAEALTPTYGILTVSGVVCLVLGALMLLREPLLPIEWFRTFKLIVLGMAGVSAAFFGLGLRAVLRIQKRKATTGTEELIGKITKAETDIDPEGTIKVRGETWSAKTEGGAIKKGASIKIIGREGLTLIVEKIEEYE